METRREHARPALGDDRIACRGGYGGAVAGLGRPGGRTRSGRRRHTRRRPRSVPPARGTPAPAQGTRLRADTGGASRRRRHGTGVAAPWLFLPVSRSGAVRTSPNPVSSTGTVDTIVNGDNGHRHGQARWRLRGSAVSKLKVFLSWSGEPSRQCALLLRGTLPAFNPLIEPFVSSEDIAKGDRGYDAIAARLAGSQFGIVCVTPENRRTPWINFEAGALSRELGGPRLAPFLLLGTTVTDLVGTPLTQFQATPADVPEEVLSLIKTINRLCEVRQDEKLIDDLFEKYWPELRDGLTRITLAARDAKKAEGDDAPVPRPSEEEIQDQMLSLLRQQVDRISALEQAVAEGNAERASDLRKTRVLFDGMFADLGRPDPDPRPEGRANADRANPDEGA
ncbi:TIR domain-containing protein [Streptomyces ipomoeae]|nr:TIR domain-containing protein [Streptomyces ipomoeae]